VAGPPPAAPVPLPAPLQPQARLVPRQSPGAAPIVPWLIGGGLLLALAVAAIAALARRRRPPTERPQAAAAPPSFATVHAPADVGPPDFGPDGEGPALAFVVRRPAPAIDVAYPRGAAQ
jgi:hypothetical protein